VTGLSKAVIGGAYPGLKPPFPKELIQFLSSFDIVYFLKLSDNYFSAFSFNYLFSDSSY
jgi:hypothetical protein